ncbi:restriction endonuclease subunit S [Chryseobacterium angstadtii]|uniref:restriction endonuclease subunit S n=1 Tax=Chryseobacterium angstadtii TaxID=558151 RepID=UPI00065AAE19|nr:restriction endonuclease subunit S [Chryseobacterium angstadtii]
MRFPGFEGEYRSYSFEDIFLFSTGKNIKQSEASPEFETPCVRYGELYHLYNEVINEVINKTNLDKSELVFSKGNEILLPSAGEDPLDIGSASALTIEGVAIGRTINILRPMNINVYSHTYASYYINQKLKKKISTLAKGVSISNVYNSDLRTLEIVLPSFSEQQKIAKFLSLLNIRITTQSKIIEGLKLLKNTASESVFAQQFRFKDSNGNYFSDWETRELGKVLDYEQPTNYLVSNTEYDDNFEIPVVTAGKTFILGYTNEIEGVFEKKRLPVIIFDDFTTASQYVEFQFKAKSSAMKILNGKDGNNIKFIYEAMQMINYKIGGHGRHWISVFSELKIPFPALGEQTKIANFLTSIDEKIKVEMTLLQQYENQKKYFLQNMFV